MKPKNAEKVQKGFYMRRELVKRLAVVAAMTGAKVCTIASEAIEQKVKEIEASLPPR